MNEPFAPSALERGQATLPNLQINVRALFRFHTALPQLGIDLMDPQLSQFTVGPTVLPLD